MNRWICVLLTAVPLAASCERSDTGARSAEQKTGAQQSEQGEARHDTGETSGDEFRGDWSDRVRDKLKSPEDERSEKESSRQPCEFFPDSCGEGEACFSSADGTSRCLAFTPDASRGDRCEAPDDCNRGQQCVGGRPGRCRPMCDPNRLDEWGCRDGNVCTRVRDTSGELFEWGVCRERRDECEPWPEDGCADGKACIQTRIGYRCQKVPRDVSVGSTCSGQRDCERAQVCVAPEGEDRECRPKCDDVHPCDSGRCVDVTDRPFGFCTWSSDESGGSPVESTESEFE